MSVSVNTWTANSGIHFKFSTILAESEDLLNYFGLTNASKSSRIKKFKASIKQILDFLLSSTGHFAIKIVSVITRFHYVWKIWNGIWTSGRGRIWNVELLSRIFWILFSFITHKLFLGNNFLMKLWILWIIKFPMTWNLTFSFQTSILCPPFSPPTSL